jgi:hypothetical protein
VAARAPTPSSISRGLGSGQSSSAIIRRVPGQAVAGDVPGRPPPPRLQPHGHQVHPHPPRPPTRPDPGRRTRLRPTQPQLRSARQPAQPLRRQAVHDREAALDLGVRVAVHDSRQDDRDPVIRQPGQDYRMAEAIHTARHQPTRARRGPERGRRLPQVGPPPRSNVLRTAATASGLRAGSGRRNAVATSRTLRRLIECGRSPGGLQP